jgi:hypothetical protein
MKRNTPRVASCVSLRHRDLLLSDYKCRDPTTFDTSKQFGSVDSGIMPSDTLHYQHQEHQNAFSIRNILLRDCS